MKGRSVYIVSHIDTMVISKNKVILADSRVG